jgi:predicted transposase/invertase (TIGR01784 family)
MELVFPLNLRRWPRSGTSNRSPLITCPTISVVGLSNVRTTLLQNGTGSVHSNIVWQFGENLGRARRRPGTMSIEDAALQRQLFGVPTFDSSFKYIMSDSVVRLEFVKVFGKLPNVKNVTLLDVAMNPIKELTDVRKFLNSEKNLKFVRKVQSNDSATFSVTRETIGGNAAVISDGNEFLHGLSKVFGDIKDHFPLRERDSQLDLICELDNGQFVLIEVQVQSQDHWDSRALAYAAGFYGNQLKRGGRWEDMKQVIAINILGKGVRESDPWKDCPHEVVRHYVFTDTANGPDAQHTIKDLQLIQYCVPHLHEKKDDETFLEWARFLQRANEFTEAEVRAMKSEAVRQAFEKARVRNMPLSVQQAYLHDVAEFGGYLQELTRIEEETTARVEKETTERVEKETTERVQMEMVRGMILHKLSDEIICNCTNLTMDDVGRIRKALQPADKV